MTATRRTFLGAALGAAAAPAAARAATAAPHAAVAPWKATRALVRRGAAIAVAPKGAPLLVAHDGRRSAALLAGPRATPQVLTLPGRPAGVAVSPDGRLGAITTPFWDHPGLTLVDLTSGRLHAPLDVGLAPGSVAFTPDGRLVLVAGGEQEGTLTVVRVADGAVTGRVDVGVVPRGLAVTRDGRAAWVALEGDGTVVRVDLARRRITRELRTPALPDRIALSPRGDRLLVTHAEPHATQVSEVRIADRHVRRHDAGPRPSAVAWTRDGRRLVAIGGGAALLVAGRSRKLKAVAGAPRDIAVAGRRVFVVGDLTEEITEVRA